jgi:hypothetical protein
MISRSVGQQPVAVDLEQFHDWYQQIDIGQPERPAADAALVVFAACPYAEFASDRPVR